MAFAAPATNPLLISRTVLGSAVSNALSLYVGRGRRYTVKQLSNATGVPDRMIECAKLDPDGLQGDAWRPLKPEELISIASFLGEAFTSEWLRLAGQGAYALPEEKLPHPGELVSECANDTAEVAEIAADGEFSERDQSTLRQVGHRFVERGMTLVSIAIGKVRKKAA